MLPGSESAFPGGFIYISRFINYLFDIFSISL